MLRVRLSNPRHSDPVIGINTQEFAMAEQTDSLDFWDRAGHRAQSKSAIHELRGRKEATTPTFGDDWMKLNTIEMLGLLDDAGCLDDLQQQIRHVLCTKFGNRNLSPESTTE